MAKQLSFDLPVTTALGREDFFISDANRLAVALIDDPARWNGNALVLTGPAGAGKSHLAHVWATRMGAHLLDARDLPGRDPARPEPLAVEDVPLIAQDGTAQEALFHHYNAMRAAGLPLLLTGRGAPRDWGLTLPDLQSRVQAVLHAALDPPDDALLAAILTKLFADRQITPRPDVVPYLVRHMERSFQAAANMVDALDQAALSERRDISRNLAQSLIGAGRAGG